MLKEERWPPLMMIVERELRQVVGCGVKERQGPPAFTVNCPVHFMYMCVLMYLCTLVYIYARAVPSFRYTWNIEHDRATAGFPRLASWLT